MNWDTLSTGLAVFTAVFFVGIGTIDAQDTETREEKSIRNGDLPLAAAVPVEGEGTTRPVTNDFVLPPEQEEEEELLSNRDETKPLAKLYGLNEEAEATPAPIVRLVEDAVETPATVSTNDLPLAKLYPMDVTPPGVDVGEPPPFRPVGPAPVQNRAPVDAPLPGGDEVIVEPWRTVGSVAPVPPITPVAPPAGPVQAQPVDPVQVNPQRSPDGGVIVRPEFREAPKVPRRVGTLRSLFR